ncbi:MAG: response regulator [Pseudobacteriovorax sp.]|nr:response regulator [Pseudobacteriovorax sp.]
MAKILIADDVKEMRSLIQALMEREGYEVLLAKNGSDVLSYHRDFDDIDLSLLDINLPDLSGIEAAKKIKARFPERENKICFISGERDKSTVLNAMASGGEDYVVKPIDPSILLEKIHKLLGDGGTGEFASLRMNAKAKLLGLPIGSDIWIKEISETGLELQSTLPFEKGGLMEVLCDSINRIANKDVVFPSKINRVTKHKDYVSVHCKFVGLHESSRKVIRALIMQQVEIDD